MAPLITRLTSKGQFTLPKELREALGVAPGDYLALTLTPEGVLVSAAEISTRQQGDLALRKLVQEIGKQLEARGIVDEEQLDTAIDEIKREVYGQRYGRRAS